jgi:hypothetical protein
MSQLLCADEWIIFHSLDGISEKISLFEVESLDIFHEMGYNFRREAIIVCPSF